MTGAAGCVQSIRVLRVLCREEFSVAAAKTFVEDLKRAMQWLTGHYMYTPEQVPTAPTLYLLHDPDACWGVLTPQEHVSPHDTSCISSRAVSQIRAMPLMQSCCGQTLACLLSFSPAGVLQT